MRFEYNVGVSRYESRVEAEKQTLRMLKHIQVNMRSERWRRGKLGHDDSLIDDMNRSSYERLLELIKQEEEHYNEAMRRVEEGLNIF